MFVRGTSFTGARAIFKMAGTPIGFATNCDGGEQIIRQSLRALGSIYVLEHVPVAYDMSFSASFSRLIGQTLKSLGFWPKHMPSSEEFLQQILVTEYTTTLYDPITKQNIYSNQRVVPVSLQWSVDQQGLSVQRMVFAAEKQKEETEA